MPTISHRRSPHPRESRTHGSRAGRRLEIHRLGAPELKSDSIHLSMRPAGTQRRQVNVYCHCLTPRRHRPAAASAIIVRTKATKAQRIRATPAPQADPTERHTQPLTEERSALVTGTNPLCLRALCEPINGSHARGPSRRSQPGSRIPAPWRASEIARADLPRKTVASPLLRNRRLRASLRDGPCRNARDGRECPGSRARS